MTRHTINNLVSISNAHNHSIPDSEFCALEFFFSKEKNLNFYKQTNHSEKLPNDIQTFPFVFINKFDTILTT